MRIMHRPHARLGLTDRAPREDEADLPLAGSDQVWFDTVDVYRGAEKIDEVLFEDIRPEAQKRLSRLRKPVMGLTMDRPRVMGILNVTPDSFSDGGTLGSVAEAVARAAEMAKYADVLDIGGESTRPGAATVSDDEEIARTAPVIAAIRAAGIMTPISIDTRKSAVARAAVAAGAGMVNDVSGLTYDPQMARVVAETGAALCLMHTQGEPENMQDAPHYADVASEVFDWLDRQIQIAIDAGVKRDKIVPDPGIGFGKTLQHNLTVLSRLSLYHDLGLPVLLGASRKRFIGTLGETTDPMDRLGGSLAVALHGAAQGMQFLRVHDVKETRQALTLQRALSGLPL